MFASSPLEGLRQVWRVRVVFLCILFELWCFVPLAGADMPETCCGPGGSMVGATTAAQRAADDVVMVMAAADVRATPVIPDAGAPTITDASEVDTVAPLPGILRAGEGDRRRLRPHPPKPPKPLARPRPSPVR
jgi:hypothetical protein